MCIVQNFGSSRDRNVYFSTTLTFKKDLLIFLQTVVLLFAKPPKNIEYEIKKIY